MFQILLTEWSRGTGTTATRCVTFSDGRNKFNNRPVEISPKNDVHLMCDAMPSHSTSPPPYPHYGGGSLRFQGNFYPNPMADQEFVKVNPRHSAVPQTSYTLDRVSRIATTSLYIWYFFSRITSTTKWFWRNIDILIKFLFIFIIKNYVF